MNFEENGIFSIDDEYTHTIYIVKNFGGVKSIFKRTIGRHNKMRRIFHLLNVVLRFLYVGFNGNSGIGIGR